MSPRARIPYLNYAGIKACQPIRRNIEESDSGARPARRRPSSENADRPFERDSAGRMGGSDPTSGPRGASTLLVFLPMTHGAARPLTAPHSPGGSALKFGRGGPAG